MQDINLNVAKTLEENIYGLANIGKIKTRRFLKILILGKETIIEHNRVIRDLNLRIRENITHTFPNCQMPFLSLF